MFAADLRKAAKVSNWVRIPLGSPFDSALLAPSADIVTYSWALNDEASGFRKGAAVGITLVDARDHLCAVAVGGSARGSQPSGGSEFFLFHERPGNPANQKDRATFSVATRSDSGGIIARHFFGAISRTDSETHTACPKHRWRKRG